MKPNEAILIEGVSKSFGETRAVDSLSFRVHPGEFFAFLGVNGAGKSTTISMMCGLLTPDEGKILVEGYDPSRDFPQIAKRIGVVPQSSLLDQVLTPLQNLKAKAACYGITGKAFQARLQEISSLLHLAPILNRPLKKCSGGEKRRVDIARALFHSPEILILDEPTTGLDPQSRRSLYAAIRRLQKESGLTVLLTTHYMEEAADADYVIILNKGKIAAEGTPLSLKEAYAGDYLTLYDVDEESVKALKRGYTKTKSGYRIRLSSPKEARDMILSRPGLFTSFEVSKGKMDDVFLEVTGTSEEVEQ
ncbi:MAG: ABC transporter ATP-binding protein [Candidatus Enteromonas sp.]|nr:ABC transporter ATP-binding protein [Candidatus Enteromonas sp.]